MYSLFATVAYTPMLSLRCSATCPDANLVRKRLTHKLPGATADQSHLFAAEGIALARFLKALHRPAPPTAPRNPYRGVALSQRAGFRWS